MQFPITLGLHRSFLWERLLIVTTLLAAVAILALPLQQVIQVTLLLMLAIVFKWSWKQLSPPLSAIRLERNGVIQVAARNDQDFKESTLRGRATVHPWLTVFRLEVAGGQQYTIVLTKGSIPDGDFRRLRVFLRWRAHFNAIGDGREERYS